MKTLCWDLVFLFRYSISFPFFINLPHLLWDNFTFDTDTDLAISSALSFAHCDCMLCGEKYFISFFPGPLAAEFWTQMGPVRPHQPTWILQSDRYSVQELYQHANLYKDVGIIALTISMYYDKFQLTVQPCLDLLTTG